MLLGGILIIDPADSRLVLNLGDPIPVILLPELALLGALLVYDLRTRGQPHSAGLLGVGLFAAALVAKLTVAKTAGWASFADMLFG